MTEAESAADELPPFRRLPFAEALVWLAENGEPADPRADIDTASLERRFPRLVGVVTEDVEFAGPHGPIPARAYRAPAAAATGRGLVWVHGGAFIGGNLDMPESNWVARELASRGIPVLSVDYTKCLRDVHYPVPVDEIVAAWEHARAQSESLLGVPAESLALGGASAGGTLTAGATTDLVASGAVLPSSLVLVYPALHPNGPAASTELDPSSPHAQIALNYAGSTEALLDPRAFAGVGTGGGFPPTLIVVCEADELRPSGEAFASTLEKAGVPVSLYTEAGAAHGHINNPGDEGALLTIAAIARWLTRSS